MQIVIDIPKKSYKDIRRADVLHPIFKAIKNGTPLPKGHGRLIDADDFLTLFRDGTEGYDCATYTRYEIGKILEKDAPTIIEADKESENEL